MAAVRDYPHDDARVRIRVTQTPANGNLRSPVAFPASSGTSGVKARHLYRARYWRANHVRGMTFSARNDALALLFAYTVIQKMVDAIGGSAVWVENV